MSSRGGKRCLIPTCTSKVIDFLLRPSSVEETDKWRYKEYKREFEKKNLIYRESEKGTKSCMGSDDLGYA